MTRRWGWARWMGLLLGGALYSASGCLPPNYYATLLGDTIVPSFTTAILNTMFANAGLQP
jgi:hypothetical protein